MTTPDVEMQHATDIIVKVIRTIVEALVDDPSGITLDVLHGSTEVYNRKMVVVNLAVNEPSRREMGYVIGRHGQTLHLIRQLVGRIGAKYRTKVYVNIVGDQSQQGFVPETKEEGGVVS